MRSVQTTIGMGCFMVGSILLLAAKNSQNPWLSWLAELLIAIGWILFIADMWRRWQK